MPAFHCEILPITRLAGESECSARGQIDFGPLIDGALLLIGRE